MYDFLKDFPFKNHYYESMSKHIKDFRIYFLNGFS